MTMGLGDPLLAGTNASGLRWGYMRSLSMGAMQRAAMFTITLCYTSTIRQIVGLDVSQ